MSGASEMATSLIDLSDDELRILCKACDFRAAAALSAVSSAVRKVALEVIQRREYCVAIWALVSPPEAKQGPQLSIKQPTFVAALPSKWPHQTAVVISNPKMHRLEIVSTGNEAVGPVRSIGSRGTAPGQFLGPTGVACDGSYLYVAEYGNHRVQKLRLSDGTPVAIASEANGVPLVCPQGGALSSCSSIFYFADSHNGRIVALRTADLKPLRTYGASAGAGRLNFPNDCCEHEGTLIVADRGNARLAFFKTADGAFLRSVSVLGESSRGPLALERPFSVSVAPSGQLLVTESTEAGTRLVVLHSPLGQAQLVVHPEPRAAIGGAASAGDGRHVCITDHRGGGLRTLPLADLLEESSAPMASPRDESFKKDESFKERGGSSFKKQEKSLAADSADHDAPANTSRRRARASGCLVM